MDPSEVKNIIKDRTVAYGWSVVHYIAQKADPNRVHIIAGGNLITYSGDITTHAVDLATSQQLWNSVLITKGESYLCIDI